MQNKSINPMCINVDWLQVFCLSDALENQEINVCGRRFVLRVEDGQTPLFMRILRVAESSGRRWATILQEPRNNVINCKATMIKLENRVLYSEQFVAFLYDLMRALNVRYKGITRLDLCCDCNAFYGGLNVQRFIKKFVSGVEGVKGDIVRVGSNKFFLVGNKDGVSTASINSIRFGSFKSKIGAYIYNKTLELKEVKDKPWIRQVWLEAGLESTEKRPVWRSEISISCEGTDVLNMGTGELFRLSPRFLEYKSSVEKLFHIYAAKALHFRVCEGQKNRRNYKDMNLYGSAVMTSRPYYVSKSADTGRTEKICANKLRSLMEEYSDIAGTEVQGINSAIKFLLMLSNYKASEVKAEKAKRELNTLKATSFVKLKEADYFRALDELFEARRDFTQGELDAAWQIMGVMGMVEPMQYDDCAWAGLSNLAEY